MKIYGIKSSEAVCANCTHYRQHYVLDERGYIPVFGGHCCYPRIKNRRPCDTCERFEHE